MLKKSETDVEFLEPLAAVSALARADYLEAHKKRDQLI